MVDLCKFCGDVESECTDLEDAERCEMFQSTDERHQKIIREASSRIDPFHSHEALDRTANAVAILDVMLTGHSGFTPEEQVQAQKAILILSDLYQTIGARVL
jgi:hypothetical protein